MIDINKKYRTRDGREVRIYAVDGGGMHPVHGSVLMNNGWHSAAWEADGRITFHNQPVDLIEVKPRIQRTVWLGLYPNGGVGFAPEVNMVKRECLARVKVEIDCEEGEGL